MILEKRRYYFRSAWTWSLNCAYRLKLGFENTDNGNIPIAAGKIESVTYNKFIRDGKTDKVCVVFYTACDLLLQKHARS